jgi:signal transduction histidine kinase
VTISWSSRDAVSGAEAPTAMRWWRSLRFRFALIAGVLVLVIVSLTSVTSLWALRGATIEQLRSQAASQLGVAIVVAGDGSLPSNATNRASDIPSTLRASIRDAEANSILVFDDGSAMWAAVGSDAGRANTSGIVAVRIDNETADSQLRRTAQLVLVIDGLLTIGGMVGAWVIAGLATSRLRRVSHSIRAALSGAGPVEVRGKDEIAVLAAALNNAAEGVQKSLTRERNFAVDIAHELRTPVTALVTATHLLGPDPEADRVRKQVTRLRRLTENLIELGRASAGVAGDTAPLGDVVAHALSDLPDGCEVVLFGSSEVPVDARRFRVIVDNLLRNACLHGASPISIELAGRELRILDSGPGYPREVLENGPRRFTEPGHHTGTGLGLAIVLEYANAIGAELILSNEHGAMTRLVVAEAGG